MRFGLTACIILLGGFLMALFVSDVSDEFIKQLAKEYLLDFMTMKKLAEKYSSSPGTISKILFKGVTERILDDVTATAVSNKVRSSTDNIRLTNIRWDLALYLREVPNYEAQVEYLKQKIKEVDFQIETYDDYFSDDDSAPSKASLVSELKSLKRDLHFVKQQINN